MRSHALLDELDWRGLLYQHTDEVAEALCRRPDHRATSASIPPRRACTSAVCSSIMLLVRLQRHGHRPVALVGGGTGLIGDPGGKSQRASARRRATSSRANAAQIRKQLERFLDFTRPERGAR